MIACPARTEAPRRVLRIELRKIHPGASQPRRHFDESTIRELADSIRRYGLLSPLLVRRDARGEYALIAGERRLRALRMLGHETADAILLDPTEDDSALIALIENLQREELHFLDEAEACRKILLRQDLTQEQLAAALSKSPSALANLLRLLKLPKSVRMFVREKGLSERHARALLKLGDEDAQLRLAAEAAAGQMSVRALEGEIERQTRAKSPVQPAKNCRRIPSESADPQNSGFANSRTTKKPIARFIRDNRLVLNALNDTVRQLKRIGVRLQSRVESREGEYDVIITVRTADLQ